MTDNNAVIVSGDFAITVCDIIAVLVSNSDAIVCVCECYYLCAYACACGSVSLSD